jgi:manganese transport protein
MASDHQTEASLTGSDLPRAQTEGGWRSAPSAPSLREVHGSVVVPVDAGFWRKLLAFAGPGYLVAVGYMDPGNWATDLAGGARYGYTLLSVILISNLMAILLQALAVRLGIGSGRDLAQACRDSYSRPVTIGLWIICEIAIAACDLAEVIGAAIALNLLFGLPLIWGVCITVLDVFIVLFLQHKGFRYVEALVVALIVTIAASFAIEVWWAAPNPAEVASGLIPRTQILTDPAMLYIAIGILGATVMPHNLYLHSSIVQTRRYLDTVDSKKEAIRFATIDSSAALMSALFINGAILIVAAAVFHGTQYESVADIGDAYKLLSPLLGTTAASVLFGPECDADRHPGGTDRDGGLRQHPAASLAATAHHAPCGDRAGRDCGRSVWRARDRCLAGIEPGCSQSATAVRGVSAGQLHQRPAQNGRSGRAAMVADPRVDCRGYHCGVERVSPVFAFRWLAMYRSILVAVENSPADHTILTHVRELAALTGAELLLVHVADGWAARHFDQLKLRESEEMKADRAYLDRLAAELTAASLKVTTELAMGDPATELIRLCGERKVDLIAMSTHGHRFLQDLLRGTTVDKVRHLVRIPVLLLRAQ